MGAPAASSPSRARRARLLRAVVVILLIQLSVVNVVWIGYRTMTGEGYLNKAGFPIGGDFVPYYAVSKVVLEDGPVAAYDVEHLYAVERQLVDRDGWPWLYPPTFMLVVLPLALLPYFVALGLWIAIGATLYAATVYRIARHSLTPFLALLFPAAADVVFSGQNGFFTASLLGWGLLLLERRPVLAGVLLGLLSFKPHLGLLIPVALIAAGYWRSFAAAALTVIGFAALSAIAFGPEAWRAFADTLPLARWNFESGEGAAWVSMTSVFSAARIMGAGSTTSWLAQGLVSLTMVAAVAWLWRRPAPPPVRASGLVIATLLATPYAQFYDMAILALPIAWLIWEARADRWLPGEQAALAVLWVAPVAAWVTADKTGLQFWPVVLAALLWLVLRRAKRPMGGATP